jgi:hypothetical protein
MAVQMAAVQRLGASTGEYSHSDSFQRLLPLIVDLDWSIVA